MAAMELKVWWEGSPEAGGEGESLETALHNVCVERKTEQMRKTKQQDSVRGNEKAAIFSTNPFGKAGLGISEHGDWFHFASAAFIGLPVQSL